MVNYNSIYDLACLRKGSAEQVEVMLSKPKTKRQLKNIADATYLAEFSKKVFQSGFVWRVVEAKWDNFEELFWGFDIDKLLMMPDDMLERKSQDKKIIRNYKKIWAIRENAMFIDSVRHRRGRPRRLPGTWAFGLSFQFHDEWGSVDHRIWVDSWR